MNNSIACVLGTLLLPAAALAGEAKIGGYYKGSDRMIFVKNATIEGEDQQIALVVATSSATGGLFRLERIDAIKTAWLALEQSEDHILTTGEEAEPIYVSTAVVEAGSAKEEASYLDLVPQGNCGHGIQAVRSGTWGWGDLPTGSGALAFASKSGTTSFLFTGSTIEGTLAFGNGSQKAGTFDVEPVFPGLGIMRGVATNLEEESGKKLETEISALFATITKRSFLSGKAKLQPYLVSLSEPSGACGEGRAVVATKKTSAKPK